jgi:hypothetical protein
VVAEKYKNTIIRVLISCSFIKVILFCILVCLYGINTRDMWGPLNHNPSPHIYSPYHTPLFSIHLHYHPFHPDTLSTERSTHELYSEMEMNQETCHANNLANGQGLGPPGPTPMPPGLPLPPL